MTLWTTDLGRRYTVWAVAGDWRIMVIDEGKDYEGTYTWSGKDHGKDEDR